VGERVLHLQEEVIMFCICLMHQLHITTRVCVCYTSLVIMG
jgi:hypothetical protein